MANTNAPFGLKPIGKLGSGYNSTGTTEYDILTGTTGTIYTGDPVKMVNTGGIAVAAAGDLLLGVFQGCHFTNSSGEKVYSPVWTTLTASSDAKALVVDDPDVLFEVQSAATGSLTQTEVGLNGDIVYAAGSSTTGMSAFKPISVWVRLPVAADWTSNKTSGSSTTAALQSLVAVNVVQTGEKILSPLESVK